MEKNVGDDGLGDTCNKNKPRLSVRSNPSQSGDPRKSNAYGNYDRYLQSLLTVAIYLTR